MNRNLRCHILLTFFFAFAFIAAYWVGLPTDFNSDHITINLSGTEASSYPDLIQRTVNPLSPSWFYPADRKMEYLRPLQFLWMKAYFDLFKDSLMPFHLTAAIGFGLLAALFFYLVFRWTASLLYGWLAVVLYLSFPSNFYTLTSTFSGDFQPYISILSISALLLFARLTFTKNKPAFQFLLEIFGCVVMIWLAIKLKSSEKILPFVCLGFLVWRTRSILSRIGLLRTGTLALAAIAMLVLVVPLKKRGTPGTKTGISETSPEPVGLDKDKTMFHFHWENMLQRAFYVPGGDFPFTTPYRQNIPRSFSENLGFFMAWLFWFSLLLLPFFVHRLKPPPPDKASYEPELLQHEFWILLIWFAATVAGFANGLTVMDTRFLNFAYVPGVLLFFMGWGIWERLLPFLQQRRTLFRLLLTVLVFCTVLVNYGFYTGLTRHFGGMQWSLVEAQKDIFRFVNGREPDPWELYLTHTDLQKRLAMIDWYNLPDNWFEQGRKKIEAEGLLYFFARHEDSERLKLFREAGFDVELWRRYDFYDAPTLLMKTWRVFRNIKRKIRGKAKKHAVLVYRIKPASGASG